MIKVLGGKLVGKGIGNALQVFRDRGMLGKKKYLGRNKDKTAEEILGAYGVDAT